MDKKYLFIYGYERIEQVIFQTNEKMGFYLPKRRKRENEKGNKRNVVT